MLLADPSNWAKWNPKFVSIRRSRSGQVVPGEQFSMVSQMKRRESPSEIMVREVMPLRRVKVHQIFSHKNRTRHVEVNLELATAKGGIEVTQTLDHSKAGIPLLFDLLIWLIYRFGRSTGTQPLERLKAVAESA